MTVRVDPTKDGKATGERGTVCPFSILCLLATTHSNPLDALTNDLSFSVRMLLPSSSKFTQSSGDLQERQRKQVDIHVDRAEVKLSDSQYRGILLLVESLLRGLPSSKSDAAAAVVAEGNRKKGAKKRGEEEEKLKEVLYRPPQREKQPEEQGDEEQSGWFSYISKVAWDIVADTEYVCSFNF